MCEETKENMFTVLERGDRKIDLLKEKLIMLVGLSRVGKSCTFNWMMKHPMIGEGDQFEANYKTVGLDPSAGALGSEYTSVTLIPNSAELDSETSLVDMAGFGDSRNYIGVMGVSYFLKSVFEKGKEFKFLIVFSEHAFFDPTGASIIKTFQGFLNMWKIKLLDQKIKKQLFDSISLVITRSRMPHIHSTYLKGVINKINNPQLKLPNKELMTELVKSMIQANRLHAFQSAKHDQNPGPCDLFEHLEPMNWKFMKLHDIQQQLGQSLISIPFEADFNDMKPQTEKTAFTDAIQQRIETYTGFTSILKVLLSSLKDNWKQTVLTEQKGQQGKTVVKVKPLANLPDNFMDSVLCFKNVFQTVQNFLDNNDKYHSQDLITPEIRAEYPRTNLVQSIQNVLNIYVVADTNSDQITSFQQNMNNYSQMFQNLTDCIKPFCTSALQERMLLRLKFILKRGFRQFSKFNEITPEKISQVSQDLKDRCNNTIFNQSANEYVQNFIKPMTSELMTRIFTTISGIDEYQQLFNQYKNNYRPSIETDETKMEKELQFNGHLINISYVKADIYMKQGAKVKAGRSFIAVLKLLCDQSDMISSLGSNSNFQLRLDNLFLMKLKVVDKLVNILVALDIKKYPAAKDLAISLCKHVNEIDAAFQVYELQLKDFQNNNAKRSVIYQNYAEYCIHWGRYLEAKALFQKKLRLQTDNYDERTNTINAIYNLVEDQSRMLEDEKKNILQLQNRLPDKDEVLERLLDEIISLFQAHNPSLNTSVVSTNKS